MPCSSGERAALLEWVNLFPLYPKVESFGDLTDGYVPAKMLEDIDPEHAPDVEINKTPTGWWDKKKNLESVSTSLFRYIHDHCGGLHPRAPERDIDFTAIAKHDDVGQMSKFLAVLLLAAVRCKTNEKYILEISSNLDFDTKNQIANIIQGMTKSLADSNADTADSLTQDPDLALEAEHAALLKSNERLKKKHVDLGYRFDRLRESHDELLERTKETDRQLEKSQDAQNGDQAAEIQDLRSKLKEALGLVASHELQEKADQDTIERQKRELNSLRSSDEPLKNPRDEIKELKIMNENLQKKSNTMDRFAQKLDSQEKLQKEIQKKNENLHNRNNVLEENQKDYDEVHEENLRIKDAVENILKNTLKITLEGTLKSTLHRLKILENTLKEYSATFSSYEEQIIQLNNEIKSLKNRINERDGDIKELQTEIAIGERAIENLQESLKTGGVSPLSPPSHTTADSRLTLGDELEQTKYVNYPLQISRLEAEIQLLKNGSASTTNINLGARLEESERVRERLETNLRDLEVDYIIKQAQLAAMVSKVDSEKDKALAATSRNYGEAMEKLTATKAKLAETVTELSSRNRDLLAARSDLNAIDQGVIDSLGELKATHGLITTALEDELRLLQNKFDTLTTDFERQKSHLVDAILAKDRLAQENTKLKEGAPTSQGVDKAQTEEESKAAIQKSQEQIEKQEIAIQDLQRKLKTAEETSPDAQKAANMAMIKNLTRETSLVASAWYDITGRLQSNHVVLQRRQDAPKSWLNKQRQMLNTTPRR